MKKRVMYFMVFGLLSGLIFVPTAFAFGQVEFWQLTASYPYQFVTVAPKEGVVALHVDRFSLENKITDIIQFECDGILSSFKAGQTASCHVIQGQKIRIWIEPKDYQYGARGNVRFFG